MNVTTDFQIFEAKRLAPLNTREALIDEVWRGLLKRPRSLVPWMLYDSEGSRLFERITTLPEYYPTRTERDILASYAEAIITATGSAYSRPLRLLELGAGTAAKTGVLLRAATRLRNEVLYFPVDVSPDALDAACNSIGYLLPDVQLQPMVANYVTHPPKLERFNGTTIAMYIGSNIGNFSPGEARTILRNLRSQLRPGDALLLGTDMVKDETILVRAYDDKDGVTAAFNLNILHRLNRELGANFDTRCFRHRALWNRMESRIEMHLESTRDQCVNIRGAQLNVQFSALETIHTENSYKFTRKTLGALLDDAGFAIEQTWTDPLNWYTLTLAGLQ
ncbi:MAG TPA: L-histidine N(alpha)-methyltransferase [Bryobacteraceae bacterium]|nr:L-histidine N(alpha)-methyltransferase [Bryobacteraceae bacterium]